MVSQLSTGEGNFLCHLFIFTLITPQNQMKLNRTVAIGFAALLLCATACRRSGPAVSHTQLVAASAGNEVKYARGFTLSHQGGITRISVRNPWDTASFIATYYLVRNARVRVPAGGRKVVVPVRRMVVTSSTHYEPLQLIGELSSIVGVCNPDRIYNTELRRAVAQNKVMGLGDNFSMNRERLLLARPDAVLTTQYAANDKYAPLIEAEGIPVLYNQEWQEPSLLGRAEWIKFVAAFYGKEKLADSLFEGVAHRYLALKALAAKAKNRPQVFSGCGFRGTWYVPGGRSYMASLYADAGARYFYAGDSHTGSLPLSFESVLCNFSQADYWFGAQENTLSEVLAGEPRCSIFRSYRSGRIYNYNRRRSPNGSSDFWEGCISHPDLLLADVIKALHPELLPHYQFYYMQQLGR